MTRPDSAYSKPEFYVFISNVLWNAHIESGSLPES